MDDHVVMEVLREGLRGIENQFIDFRKEMRGQMKEMNEAVTKRLDNHSDRIRSLENWRSWLVGGLAAMGVAIATAWTGFTEFFRRK